jgi:fumarate reductase subunit D
MTAVPRMRSHASSRAALAHRLSGLALAAFLPVHFWALGTSLGGEAALQSTLAWTQSPLVKFAEWGLVVLLALHLGLGLRVLALEFLPWHGRQRGLAAAAAGFAGGIGVVFAMVLVLAR